MDWTEAEIQRLKSYREAGLSFSQIEPLVGHSRNACIGKAKRLGLCGTREAAAAAQRQRARPKKAAAPRKPQPLPFVPDPSIAAGEPPAMGLAAPGTEVCPAREVGQTGGSPAAIEPRLITELGPGDCRWPSGDGPILFTCSGKGQPYCAHHARIAGRPYTGRGY